VSRQTTAQRREENEVEFSRIVAFSDGVFAIAITLLVLNLELPATIPGHDLGQALWDERQDLFAYAFSFAVIGRFWVVHHRLFSSVTGFDGRLLALNLFYLGWIALLPFSSEVLGDHGADTAAIVLYALNLSGVTLTGTAMLAYARRAGLSEMPVAQVREGTRRSFTIAAVFLSSIPVAYVAPNVAAWLWLALFVDPIGRRLTRRRAGESAAVDDE
jgi:uncharacterized membrane protein